MERRFTVAGILAPVVVLGGSLVLSHVQRSYMNELGWDVWPSGLALGPHGWGAVVVFLGFAALYIAFLLSVCRLASWSRLARGGSRVALALGSGTALLPFNTDRPGADMTWHGALHGAGYLALLASLLVLFVAVLPGLIRRGGRAWRATPAALLLIPFAWTGPNDTVASNYIFFAIPFTVLAAMTIVLLRMPSPPATGATSSV